MKTILNTTGELNLKQNRHMEPVSVIFRREENLKKSTEMRLFNFLTFPTVDMMQMESL